MNRVTAYSMYYSLLRAALDSFYLSPDKKSRANEHVGLVGK